MAEKLKSGDVLTNEQLRSNFKVYAGPGAGKTHFLVENIKNIISSNDVITKSKARKVLCITYTNAAVDEIKRRLEDFSDCIEAYTIHGFIIENIIKRFQETLIEVAQSDFHITLSNKGIISSQIEGLGILHGIDKEEIFNFIRTFEDGKYKDDTIDYSKKIMGDVQVDNNSFISALAEGTPISPTFTHSKKIKNGHDVAIKTFTWDIVRKLTHDEVLYFGFRILQTNPTALYALRVKYPFIFVDEFQDTNPLQTLIVKLIGEKSTIIGVVGDIAQSIYSFQGAKPSDFSDFIIDNRTNKVYSIDGNRRSTQNIINFCNFLRQSDKTVVQTSVKEYSDEEVKSLAESKSIHFLLGESPEIKTLISSVVLNGGVVLTRTWAAAFNYIQNIDASQTALLSQIYNSYTNTPIQIRDEITEYNNVTWVRAFRFIFSLYIAYSSGSFIDMIKAIKFFSDFKTDQLTPKIVFEFDKLAKTVFSDVKEDTIVVNLVKEFNNEVAKQEFLEIRQLLNPECIFTIQIFDEQEREELIKAVSELQWNTAFKLFTEVFAENSKYMTVHQAKGLEWKTVIVSMTPTRRDGTTLSRMFSSPTLSAENSADEFTRMYYVASSRAIEDLYIHMTDGCTQQEIESSLLNFSKNTGLSINYEFIE